MTKREAIEILEEAIEILKKLKTLDDSMFAYSPYSQAYNDALDMAIEALKAQEPQVLAFEELSTYDGAFIVESRFLCSKMDEWCYYFDSKGKSIWICNFDGERYELPQDDYGVYVRCWTSRPTDKQREATPWEVEG